jgi:hypothetical protein
MNWRFQPAAGFHDYTFIPKSVALPWALEAQEHETGRLGGSDKSPSPLHPDSISPHVQHLHTKAGTAAAAHPPHATSAAPADFTVSTVPSTERVVVSSRRARAERLVARAEGLLATARAEASRVRVQRICNPNGALLAYLIAGERQVAKR